MELTPGYKQTDLGVIPADWDTPLLDAIAKRGSGHTPDKKHPEYWNGSISWVSLKDSDSLDTLFIEETAATITPEGIANSSAVLHPAGTVVLSRDAGVGKSAIMKRAMAVSQHFMAWQCSSNLDNVFLYYSLQAAKPEFERIAMGSTIKTIGLPFFRSFRITKPPLQEQRAIAAALSDVDALLAKLDQLIAKKRDLKQAAMQQLLTGQNRLPGFSGERELLRIDEIANVKTGPFGSSLHESDYVQHGTPIITVEHLGEFGVTRQNLPLVSDQDCKRLQAYSLEVGDIVFSRVGSVDRNALIRKEEEGWLFSGRLLRVRPDQKRVNSPYLSYVFHTESFRNSVLAVAVGQTMASLNTKILKDLTVLLPSLEEQTAIATILSDMDTELAALEARRDKTRALKQGMMQELLTGRIRLV